MPERSQDDVLVYIFDKKRVSASEIEREFVGDDKDKPSLRIARGTLYSWLRTLCASNVLVKKFDTTRKERGTYVYYSISSEYYDEVEAKHLKSQLHEKVDLLSKEDLLKLLEQMNDLESEKKLLELTIEDDLPWDLFDKAEVYLDGKDQYGDDHLILKKVPESELLRYGDWKRIKFIRNGEGIIKFIIFAMSKEKARLLKVADKSFLQNLRIRYDLTDEEWLEIEKPILNMMESDCIAEEFDHYIRSYKDLNNK